MEGDAVIDPDVVAANVERLRATIGRHASRPVRIVAVTKRFGPDAVHAALAAGIDDVGENYAQELVAKATELAAAPARQSRPASWRLSGLSEERGRADGSTREDSHDSRRGTSRESRTEHRGEPIRAVSWHFIGHVQRNKVKLLAPWVSLWHTVDSVRLGAEIARRAPGAAVLVQINATGVSTQSGVELDAVPGLVDELRALDLDVRGLMTIGAIGDLEASRSQFRAIRTLADRLELTECSMGMSGDLEAALEEGSTLLRVGTGIFGARPAD